MKGYTRQASHPWTSLGAQDMEGILTAVTEEANLSWI